jgi:small subunit ribosomal protein S20
VPEALRRADPPAVDGEARSPYTPASFGGPVPPLLFSHPVLGFPAPAKRTLMANSPSAKKSARKIVKRAEVNKSRRSRVRTFIRKVEEAIAGGKHEDAMAALKAAEPEIARAASKGIVHANVASRKVSRLNHRVKALKA